MIHTINFRRSNNSSNDTIQNNIIAHQDSAGIFITNPQSSKNIIHENSIFDNGTYGAISFGNGVQEFVKAPKVEGIMPDSTVYGSSAPGAYIQIYQDLNAEGETFLAATNADAGGKWQLKTDISLGQNVTALQDSSGNTSVFSAAYLTTGDIDLANISELDFGTVQISDSLTISLMIYNNGIDNLTEQQHLH